MVHVAALKKRRNVIPERQMVHKINGPAVEMQGVDHRTSAVFLAHSNQAIHRVAEAKRAARKHK